VAVRRTIKSDSESIGHGRIIFRQGAGAAARKISGGICGVTVRRAVSPAPRGGSALAVLRPAQRGDCTDYSSEELAHVVPAVAHSLEAVATLPLDLKRRVSLTPVDQ
jgi:hypothetical protein